MTTDHATVLFDGVCNLCSWSVQFIIQRDPHGYFKFASMQSEIGRQLMADHHLPAANMDTFILIEGDVCLTRSDAAIAVATHLSGQWSLLRGVSVIPKPVRDWGYTMIAKNRYRWFGVQATCLLPSPEIRDRFLNSDLPRT